MHTEDLKKIPKRHFPKYFRAMALFVILTFSCSVVIPPQRSLAQVIPSLPTLPLSDVFAPAMLKGIKIHPDNPFRLDFVVDMGDTRLKGAGIETESKKLIKYFLASLTIPEEDLWVNLSPYEKDRVVPEELGITEMGRDLLAQDYVLKQLMASLSYPDSGLGKEFWDRVFRKAYEVYGRTDMPLNTFNKVWIVPDKALVYEKEDTVFVVEKHLKVMLEEDYLSLNKNLSNKEVGTESLEEQDVKVISNVSSEIAREVLLPEIEKEVNEGKNFVQLRQIYSSLILAAWYKRRIKVGTDRDLSLLGQIYVDQKKVVGVEVEDKEIKEKIYAQYIEAFRDGVYDIIREGYDDHMKEVIARKYFSGGFKADMSVLDTTDTISAETAAEIGNDNCMLVRAVLREPALDGIDDSPAQGVVEVGERNIERRGEVIKEEIDEMITAIDEILEREEKERALETKETEEREKDARKEELFEELLDLKEMSGKRIDQKSFTKEDNLAFGNKFRMVKGMIQEWGGDLLLELIEEREELRFYDWYEYFDDAGVLMDMYRMAVGEKRLNKIT